MARLVRTADSALPHGFYGVAFCSQSFDFAWIVEAAHIRKRENLARLKPA